MTLVILITNFGVLAQESKKDKEFPQKVKSEVTKLGTGPDAKIQVKLKDGTKIKGHVIEVKDEGLW
jgi:hypothetical protein